CAGHDAGGVFPLRGLAMQVRHGACIPGAEPLIELARVRVRLESGDPDRVESQRESSTLYLDAVARRLCVFLLDAFFHTCIVSLRHRAKRTTSSSGGTASSSP